MTAIMATIAQVDARAEGWIWGLIIVTGLIAVLFAVISLRRHLMRPMPHAPSDTTDAWKEAGRRMAVPPPGQDEPDSEDRGNS